MAEGMTEKEAVKQEAARDPVAERNGRLRRYRDEYIRSKMANWQMPEDGTDDGTAESTPEEISEGE